MAANILLVDDDAVQAATRKAILERAGHSVKIAGSGTDALEFVHSRDGYATRMVVTDHSMPGMGGPQLVGTLRADGFLFPVVVLSGYADAEDDYESLDAVFRLKPFPPDQLISLVNFLLAAAERRTA
jgi:CheY-like chemotaxis protein